MCVDQDDLNMVEISLKPILRIERICNISIDNSDKLKYTINTSNIMVSQHVQHLRISQTARTLDCCHTPDINVQISSAVNNNDT